MSNKKAKQAKQEGAVAHTKELNPWPGYIQERLDKWHKYMGEYKAELAAKVAEPIRISLPDGVQHEAESWRTTPLRIAENISKGLADHAIICKVDGKLWDLDRPFEKSCSLEILKFDDDEAKKVYWHSTAHVLGEAMERYYGGCLCYGPPIEQGFYYDMFMNEGQSISSDHFDDLHSIMTSAVKEKQPFERLELTKAQLLDMFHYNEFKLRIINERITEPKTTVYRCGPLIDLCLGPHVRHTGRIKAMSVLKTSCAFWEGNADAEVLSRVYGISFPEPKQLKQWQKIQEEAAQRDHRKLGRDQDLFVFHAMSPGSPFFFPKGAYIYNTLMDFIRKQYRKRGYQEVMTPNIYNSKLWEKSGHWQHYSDNMFKFEAEKDMMALKPMNCPGHCLMFDVKPRTHNELPMRFADFGVLHRNELSGALSGLTRVRRFQQDDAHLFCRLDQITNEIKGVLDFMSYVYVDVFGFSFKLFLSTRPEKDYLGTVDVWDKAEGQLTQALNEFGHKWELNPGDGAFYGPKIDIQIKDALGREHQCATIQLDFQLPERFELNYIDAEGNKVRPVIIHRAILGSVERMIAILTENHGGKWPFWLSPRQIMVVPVHESLIERVTHIRDKLYAEGFECDTNVDMGDTLNRKIRLAQMAQYNFILVIGEKEANNNTANVRTRDNKQHGELSLEELIKRFKHLKDNHVRNSEEEFETIGEQLSKISID